MSRIIEIGQMRQANPAVVAGHFRVLIESEIFELGLFNVKTSLSEAWSYPPESNVKLKAQPNSGGTHPKRLFFALNSIASDYPKHNKKGAHDERQINPGLRLFLKLPLYL